MIRDIGPPGNQFHNLPQPFISLFFQRTGREGFSMPLPVLVVIVQHIPPTPLCDFGHLSPFLLNKSA
jgi:hypothetical protein